MKRIGITGGIGSGKTTVCKIFESLGVPVFYADDEWKKLLEKSEISLQLKKVFGEKIFSKNQLNKKLLAKIVFADKKKLAQLNAIAHPAVAKRFDEWCEENSSHPYLIHEAALIFEAGVNKHLEAVVHVHAADELRIERVMKRDKITKAEIVIRMKNQFSEKKKMTLATYVLSNNESELLIPQILKLHKKFSSGKV